MSSPQMADPASNIAGPQYRPAMPFSSQTQLRPITDYRNSQHRLRPLAQCHKADLFFPKNADIHLRGADDMSVKNLSRRSFIAAGAIGLASAPSFAQVIARALATPANQGVGGLKDVEHIVFLMQENRSFDHYFGSLAGARGFNDPRAIQLPSGKPVWYQTNGSNYVLPYHFDARNTNALKVGLDHAWKGSETTWKDWNAWVYRKTARSMGFFNRSDLPFYYALADAFTVCDAYHCSVFGPTDPNRLYALSGHSNGFVTGLQDSRLYNVNNGTYNADITNDNPAAKGLEWQSYAEVLEANGISWKVYQEWDNYGDNYLQYFKHFRVDANGQRLSPDNPLYQRCRATAAGSTAANAPGTSGQWLIDEFAADVKADRLPQVSWICAPTEYCEHPSCSPNAGEHFAARLLTALVDNPAVWSKTVLIITYDENDGFFDHMPPTMPPLNSSRGRTTLHNATDGEVYNSTEPIGLGPRVPTLVVSPWSKGGRLNSQLFDHTSMIRLLEEWLVQGKGLPRNQVQCNAISPWRRAVCGDLTSTLVFSNPNATWPNNVPRNADYFKLGGGRDALPPAVQSVPKQEVSTTTQPRLACPLPYQSSVTGSAVATAGKYALSFANTGTTAAAFIVYSALRNDGPWHYTVEAGKRIDWETWTWNSSQYHLNVLSHNGFAREFGGSVESLPRKAEVSLEEVPSARYVRLTFHNNGTQDCSFKLVDNAYGDTMVKVIDVPAGQSRTIIKSVYASYGWYDLGIKLKGDDSYWRRLAGHLEGAGLDYTDPVLNGQALAASSPQPKANLISGVMPR
ncbi:phosphocholine-specific phospholipase C [Chitinimonas sp. BJB300]|uniref:phosphocholine-specific phospholipase C n=1 Tax=Chitinimonas sp. BJB300 TaxID=1559339 RepID=UPI000C0FF044|nr:phospholipase C, phosphocholine-specific [Chitinimonas sp. BJB300]PHV13380.1 phospholipase C, phosphocholine-specific [Chitinimonas sp. BJB300]TSJ85297.1 phospholipase C, phosphocholine-specific [Chitinimonas sp. BJB300]